MCVSGRVTRADNQNPVTNLVVVAFANATNAPANAPFFNASIGIDTKGWYSITNIPFGWYGTVVPSHPYGGSFTPPITIYANLTVNTLTNYVWNPPPPTIAGQVLRSDGTPASGVSLIFSNDASMHATNNVLAVALTDSNGNYRVVVGNNGAWSGTVTPVCTQYAGAVFSPAQRVFTGISADVTDTNLTRFTLYSPLACLKLQVSPASLGTVTGATDGWYTVGSSFTITANTNTFSRFVSWLEDSNSNATRTVVLAPGTNTFTASFINIGPLIVFVPSSVNFGNIFGNQTVYRTISAINVSTNTYSQASLGYITTNRPPLNFTISSSGAFPLNPGQTQVITVAFAPGSVPAQDLPSVFAGTFVLVPNLNAPSVYVPFHVQAVMQNQLSSSLAYNSLVDFGSVYVGATATQTLQITSLCGDLSMPLRDQLAAPGFAVNGFPVTVPIGGTGTVTVTFSPAAAQDYSGTLTILASGVTPTTTAVTLKGHGTNLQCNAIFKSVGSGMGVNFCTLSGTTYTVVWRTNLLGGVGWHPYASFAGLGGVTNISFTNGLPQAFFKITSP